MVNKKYNHHGYNFFQSWILFPVPSWL